MGKRNFITPVSMKCTEEQYERDLKETLEKLGYDEDLKCSQGEFENDLLCCVTYNDKAFYALVGKYSHFWVCSYKIDHYNPELFLALAAMTDGTNPKIGEYVAWLGGNPQEYMRVRKYGIGENCYTLADNGYNSCHISYIRKHTMDELIEHFTNNQSMKKENRFPFQLEECDARRIIDIACSRWKGILAGEWGTDLILKGSVTITEEYYKEMREACTEGQHALFDEIFGKDKKLMEEILRSIIDINTKDSIHGDAMYSLILETFDIKLKE
jgi:hypothetical protein